MNNRFKFRIWNAPINKMVFGPTDDNPNPSWILALGNTVEFPVQQFTGFYDTNSVEIYEGDIVRYDNKISEVQWNEDNGQFLLQWEHSSREQDNEPLTCDTAMECKVLGNKFKNPALYELTI